MFRTISMQQLEQLLDGERTFAAEAFSLPGPVGDVPEGMVTLYPHRHGTDGFFICRMRRTAGNG